MKWEIEDARKSMGLDTFSLFFYAYAWKHKQLSDVTNDVILYQHLDLVPDYVREYIEEYRRRV